MRSSISRRQWLKTSAVALAGLMAEANLGGCRREKADSPYLPFEDEPVIRLNNNESPYGISPKAWEAIVNGIDKSNRYPHGQYSELKELIAMKERLSPDHIFLGAGSTEVMTTILHFAGWQGEVLAADPTYFDFVYYAKMAGIPLISVPLNQGYEHDLKSMESRITPKTSLVYICNPNNPTGSITPRDESTSFCGKTSRQTLILIDEAYHEYVDDPAYGSMVELVRDGVNVIVTRTFSKIFGLAGLRVGYGLAKPEVIQSLERASRNFAPVSWLSLRAALAGYQDLEFIQHVRANNNQVKHYLYRELERLGLAFVPSHTNFVLFNVARDSAEMSKEFEARNILVRPFTFRDSHWVRVSLGTMPEMQAFVSVLMEIA